MCDESGCIDFNSSNRFAFLRPEAPLISPPKVEIYLAGAQTNNDQSVQVECDVVRAAVKSALHGYDYLGVEFNVYDPADYTSPGSAHSSQQVYTIDHKCTVCSDLVIFHVNAPSLGVGIEAQLSAMATTPRIIISKGTVPTSRMFAGMFCSTIAEIQYSHVSEVIGELHRRLQDICPKTIESVERRRPHLIEIQEQRIGERFLMQRIRHGISISSVAQHTDMQATWLREIECCPELGTTLGVMPIRRISEALRCCTHQIEDGTFRVTDCTGALEPTKNDSLRNLARFANGLLPLPENRIFRLWDGYASAEQRKTEEATKYRQEDADSEPVSIDEWHRRYDNMPLFD